MPAKPRELLLDVALIAAAVSIVVVFTVAYRRSLASCNAAGGVLVQAMPWFECAARPGGTP